jgi:hypothetical protein
MKLSFKDKKGELIVIIRNFILINIHKTSFDVEFA